MYKALIVDDEQMIREDLQDFVGWKEAGFTEVHQAGNGAQALKIAADIRFDLVLADINMPGMNGIEMIRRLREQGCQAAMVVITAYGEFEYAKQAISLGVKEYVLKPIDFGELQALVSRIAGQLRATTEEERNRQFVREAELACAELLESAALLRREKAEEAVERLFAAQHALCQPLESVFPLLRQTIAEAESQLNSLDSSGYAARQGVFLELLQRLAACESRQEAIMLFRHLAAHLTDGYEEAGTTDRSSFSHLKALIREHLEEDISLEWLAQRVHRSANYLSVVFKRETGENFNEFLMRERMMVARQLLGSKEHRIVDVGMRVGYANYRSFNRAFKNYFGQSPSDYRSQYGSKP